MANNNAGGKLIRVGTVLVAGGLILKVIGRNTKKKTRKKKKTKGKK